MKFTEELYYENYFYKIAKVQYMFLIYFIYYHRAQSGKCSQNLNFAAKTRLHKISDV